MAPTNMCCIARNGGRGRVRSKTPLASRGREKHCNLSQWGPEASPRTPLGEVTICDAPAEIGFGAFSAYRHI